MAAGQIRAPIIIPLKSPYLTKTKSLTTDTKVDLISESADTDIYFTVNGYKPEPFKTIGDKNTFKFSVPFSLPAGKRTVKAIAITRDGSRESNVVTKVFEIEKVQNTSNVQTKLQQDDYGFLDDLKDTKKFSEDMNFQELKPSEYTKQEAFNSNNSSGIRNSNLRSVIPQYLSTRSSTNKKYGKMPEYLSNLNLENTNDINTSLVKFHKKEAEDDKIPTKTLSDSSYLSMRLQRETDFLKCIYCLAPRPSDPYSKFCNNCGQAIPPLPQSRLPPPENGQLGMCIHCRSTVPMNIFNCLVCEAPLNIQNQPQATNKLRERVLCTICGTTNPPNIDSCLTCEAKLPESGKAIKMHHPNQPPVPPLLSNNTSPDVLIAKCLKCNRQNNVDARFCDWCGNKFSVETSSQQSYTGHITCLKCGANNHHNATYCCQCGNTIIAPQRQVISLSNGTLNSQRNSISIPLYNTNCLLKPENILSQNGSTFNRKTTCDISTQTVGLFYPSTAQLKKNEGKEKPSTFNSTWDKSIPLSLISPGKGYWRKQIEHIICHLKAFVSNSSEFQALIGEPRMGKLITADVQEEDTELNINLVFALKGYNDPYPRENSAEFDRKYLSSMLKRTGSFDSFRSDDTLQSNEILKPQKTPTTSSRCRSGKRKPINKKQSKSLADFILSDAEKNLLKEIGQSGEGRSSEIEKSLDEGADAKGKNGKGVPFIVIAARNKHRDAIRILCKFGANINETEPEFGNTALHEAVTLGPTYFYIVDELLDCGSSTKIKNKKGELPSDLAMAINNNVAIKQLSSKEGKNQIEKLIKPKPLDDSDDEKI